MPSCRKAPASARRNTRAETPALLKGLLYGPDGAAFSPTHTRKGDRLYRYYVSQTVLKHGAGACPVARVPAAEIEAAVIDQIRGMLRAPEVVMATWRAAQPDCEGLAEDEVRKALAELDPLWAELFPAEQARIIQLLIERVDIGTDGLKLRFRDKGHYPDGGRGRKHGGQDPESCCMTEQTVTVTVPFAVRKRGGRKLVITPDGVTAAPAPRANVDSALLKALARGFRWRKLLETGDYLDHRGNRRRREHQSVLRQPGAAHDAAGARDRGGHPGRAATAGANDEDSDGSVSGRVEGSNSFLLKSQLSQDVLLLLRAESLAGIHCHWHLLNTNEMVRYRPLSGQLSVRFTGQGRANTRPLTSVSGPLFVCFTEILWSCAY